MTLKIRSLTASAYSSYVMLLGNYPSRWRNLWRSTNYDWFVSSSIGYYIEIALKYSDIQRVIRGEDVKSEIHCQKKKSNNSATAKLYDCRIYWTSEVWTPMFRNFHQCLFVFFTPHLHQQISVFAHLRMWTLALIFCKRLRLVEQFPRK